MGSMTVDTKQSRCNACVFYLFDPNELIWQVQVIKRPYLLKHPLGAASSVHIWFICYLGWIWVVHFSSLREHLMMWPYRILLLEEMELISEYTAATLKVCVSVSWGTWLIRWLNGTQRRWERNVAMIQCVYENTFFDRQESIFPAKRGCSVPKCLMQQSRFSTISWKTNKQPSFCQNI